MRRLTERGWQVGNSKATGWGEDALFYLFQNIVEN